MITQRPLPEKTLILKNAAAALPQTYRGPQNLGIPVIGRSDRYIQNLSKALQPNIQLPIGGVLPVPEKTASEQNIAIALKNVLETPRHVASFNTDAPSRRALQRLKAPQKNPKKKNVGQTQMQMQPPDPSSHRPVNTRQTTSAPAIGSLNPNQVPRKPGFWGRTFPSIFSPTARSAGAVAKKASINARMRSARLYKQAQLLNSNSEMFKRKRNKNMRKFPMSQAYGNMRQMQQYNTKIKDLGRMKAQMQVYYNNEIAKLLREKNQTVKRLGRHVGHTDGVYTMPNTHNAYKQQVLNHMMQERRKRLNERLG